MSEFLSTSEVARRLGISRQAVSEAYHGGRLEAAAFVGQFPRFTAEDVNAWRLRPPSAPSSKRKVLLDTTDKAR